VVDELTLEPGEQLDVAAVARARVKSSWTQRMTKRSNLNARLAEQEEQLRLAADRHAAQLVRLRDHADKLRTTAELSELARQARDGRETT
jgi:hypothetical protein